MPVIFRKILPLTTLFLFFSCIATTQYVANFYEYNMVATEQNPIFEYGEHYVYQPLAFFFWASSFPHAAGVIRGWVLLFSILMVGIVTVTALWLRRYMDSKSAEKLCESDG